MTKSKTDSYFINACKDLDFKEALLELDKEFPGAKYDDSLNDYIECLEHKRLNRLTAYSFSTIIYNFLFSFSAPLLKLHAPFLIPILFFYLLIINILAIFFLINLTLLKQS